MLKSIKKIVSLLLCTTLLCCFGSTALADKADDVFSQGDVTGKYSYSIESPYETVDWSTWKQYKASLHSHTNASDGAPSIEESIEKHYELGFQILAITDHAVIGAQWDEVPQMVPLYRLVKFERTLMKDPVVLTSERRQEIFDGVGRDAATGGMLEVTGACEANGATPINDCHINTFWSDYGQARMGLYGDYETVVKECDADGGISFLDHTGEYVGCEDDVSVAYEPYYANKFANIFLTYASCVAYDVNSGRNNRTRYDVVLWDEILKLTIPQGRNVSCITFSDGHLIDEYDRAFTMMCMPENTVPAFRNSMETGAWFSVGRYARMDLGEDFIGEGAVPEIYSVNINEDTDTISFDGGEYTYVKWISGGKVIAEGEDVNSIDLNAYEDELDCYVRFQITGPGGILYSQAFVTMADGVDYTSTVYKTFDFSTMARACLDVMEKFFGRTWFVIIVRKLLWNHTWD